MLQFISERLRMLPLSMLKLLCPAVQLQQREQHGVVYNNGEDSTHLYLVLSGILSSLIKSHTMSAPSTNRHYPGVQAHLRTCYWAPARCTGR